MSGLKTFSEMHLSKKQILKGFFIGLIVFFSYRFFRMLGKGEEMIPGPEIFKDLLIFLLTGILFVFIFGIWNHYVNDKVKGLHPAVKIALSSLVTTFLLVLMMWLLRFLLIVIMAGVDFDLFMADEKLEWYKIGFVVASIFSVSFHIISHVRQREKRLVAEQTFLAGTASAELNALKSQLDPHFLFNSLNVLAGLIEENPEKAQDFTVGLSKVYRYVLEQKDKEWVSAQEELNFAKSYLQLMQMRFENSLVVDLPDSLSDTHWRMAPLTLQLLLENAVKHNEAGNRKPLYIRVYESEGKLVVENNFQPRENLGVSTGKGLQNIRQRYGLLTDQPIEVSQNNQKFKVSIPLLIQKKSNMKTTEMNQSYLNARKRLDDLKEFYGSLTSYIIVIPILIFINYRTFWGFQWFWFPMLGWGIGLAFQAAKVYFPNSNWEERKLKQFMDEERRKMM